MRGLLSPSRLKIFTVVVLALIPLMRTSQWLTSKPRREEA